MEPKILYLEGKRMQHPESAHEHLRHILHFPSFYGNTLDALYDCLTEIGEPTILEISDSGMLFPKIRMVLLDAAEENELLQIRMKK